MVFKQAFGDLSVVDRATEAFLAQIAAEKAAGTAAGDHFAKPGANDRVWGALDKLAVADPAVFADYYANDVIALISEAWLGPDYQVTSQVNVVNPGGQAQTAHRDYHLGFMDAAAAARFPAQVHRLSPALTLQGAVAHCDMPVETGPTLYLPYSHQYEPGYLAFHLPEFTEYFQANYTQLPLEKGDAAFFNPALFHGAGTNVSTDVRRMANLLQVSSPFGRAMETVDRVAMCRALFPVLLEQKAAGVPDSELDNVIAASAEGYAFPTNLDRDQPIDGLAPQTQADLVRQAARRGVDAGGLRVRPGRPGRPHPPRPRLNHMPTELLATCWTHTGDALPVPGRHLSPLDLRARAEAVAAAGFTGIGFTIDDLEAAQAHLRAGRREADLRRPGPGPPRGRAARGLVDDAAHAVRTRTGNGGRCCTPPRSSVPDRSRSGPTSVFVDGAVAPLTDLVHWAAELHQLAAQAADVGTRVALEPLPFSNITDFRLAAELVTAADHPAAGLVVDIWHLERGPSTLADLAEVPGDKVFVVELNDAPAPQSSDLFHDTIHHRVLCGAGNLRRHGLCRHTAADRLHRTMGRRDHLR